ncbi:hypothetical protein VTK26DRAFT_79 [Humicola hyalothermophila]
MSRALLLESWCPVQTSRTARRLSVPISREEQTRWGCKTPKDWDALAYSCTASDSPQQSCRVLLSEARLRMEVGGYHWCTVRPYHGRPSRVGNASEIWKRPGMTGVSLWDIEAGSATRRLDLVIS